MENFDTESIDDESTINKTGFAGFFTRDAMDTNDKPDTMTSLIGNAITKINWKVSIFLFLLIIVVLSDVFIEGVLDKMNGMVEGQLITRQGTIAISLIVSLSYILFSFLTDIGAL